MADLHTRYTSFAELNQPEIVPLVPNDDKLEEFGTCI